jgi:hypothetical protein
MDAKKRESEREPAAALPHYHGHRERLRERFRAVGPDALSDYELLEAVLFRALPRRDVKPLAKTLIATFGSFAEVIAAPAARLADVKGMGEASITELKIIEAAASRLLRGEVKKRPVLSSWSAALDYCRSAQAFADREHRQAQPAHRRRGAAGRHRRPCAGLSARGGQTRARTVGDRHHPRAQSSHLRLFRHAQTRLVPFNHAEILAFASGTVYPLIGAASRIPPPIAAPKPPPTEVAW